MDEVSVVEEFSNQMIEKLDQRSYKGRLGWRSLETDELLDYLQDEVEELLDAISYGEFVEASQEAIDIANCAMFLYDKLKDAE